MTLKLQPASPTRHMCGRWRSGFDPRPTSTKSRAQQLQPWSGKIPRKRIGGSECPNNLQNPKSWIQICWCLNCLSFGTWHSIEVQYEADHESSLEGEDGDGVGADYPVGEVQADDHRLRQGGHSWKIGRKNGKINIARGTMDPRYTPGSDRNSRAALFSNYVSCPKKLWIVRGTMITMLQKLTTLLIATFKPAERQVF